METIYGKIDNKALKLYGDSLKNRTFKLLYLYEQQPFETYQKHLNDLLVNVISFNSIKLKTHKDFCRYVELLTSILKPQPLENETEHSFIRRRILDSVNLIARMFDSIEVDNE